MSIFAEKRIMIKYQYSLRQNDGCLVNISAITKDNRHDGYRCLQCGNEMVPVLGEKRKPHFKHKSNCSCSSELYLHKIGKMILKRRFDESDTFPVTYYIGSRCDMKGRFCPFRDILEANRNTYCSRTKLYTIDLKKYYDICLVEKTYRGYVADLLLKSSSKPNREPVLLEIAVTHECELKKIYSGIRIIEIKGEQEQDFERDIIESEEKQHIVFYNFKRELDENAQSFKVVRFCLKKTDDYHYHVEVKEGSYCNSPRIIDSDSIEEVWFGYDYYWAMNDVCYNIDSEMFELLIRDAHDLGLGGQCFNHCNRFGGRDCKIVHGYFSWDLTLPHNCPSYIYNPYRKDDFDKVVAKIRSRRMTENYNGMYDEFGEYPMICLLNLPYIQQLRRGNKS